MKKKNNNMQKQKKRSSLRIRKYNIATALYKQKQRVKEFKKTNWLAVYKKTNRLTICKQIDVLRLCEYYENLRTPSIIKKEDRNIYRQIDDVRHRVLRGYDNIKDFLSSVVDYDTLKLPHNSNYSRSEVVNILRGCIKFIFENITFVKAGGRERDKVFAVVAGSFPTYLAGCIEKYNDIDIFLAINPSDPQTREVANLVVKIVSKMAHFAHRGWPVEYKKDSNIYTIATVGKLQFIVKDYNGCYKHINDIFFNEFHHVTRWKLKVRRCGVTGEHIICTRYIPYSKETLAERSSINNNEEEYTHLVWDVGARYPIKHFKTQTEKGRTPPTLVQQCVLTMEYLDK